MKTFRSKRHSRHTTRTNRIRSRTRTSIIRTCPDTYKQFPTAHPFRINRWCRSRNPRKRFGGRKRWLNI